MTRSMLSPLRRIAATAAIAGVTGFGAVALAPAALADETAPATASVAVDGPVVAPAPVEEPAPVVQAAPSYIQSPLPDGPVEVKVGNLKVTLPPQLAQVYQTIEANLLAQQGYRVTFDKHGKLVVGKKICDPNKPASANKDCVMPDGPRF